MMGFFSSDDGSRPATAAENRAYRAHVKRLKESQGRAAADAWVREQHRLYLASCAANRKAAREAARRKRR